MTPGFRYASALIFVATAFVMLRAGERPPAAHSVIARPGGFAEETLLPADVRRVARVAANALDSPAMVIAVVDRNGTPLGVFRKGLAPDEAPGNFPEGTDERALDPETDPPNLHAANDVALSLARTGAFFSNDEAPLSSRTVRFISGIHFPPGIRNTPSAALYGIENTNRGCSFNAPGFPVPRALRLGGAACSPFDRDGCGLGIQTGKANLKDNDSGSVNPGGLPLYKVEVSPGGRARLRLVGGVGVVVYPKGPAELLSRKERLGFGLQAEFAAGRAMRSLLSGDTDGDGTVQGKEVISCGELKASLGSLLPPGVIFLDGIRLPFIEQCGQPRGTSRDSLPAAVFADDGNYLVPPGSGASVPSGFLYGPFAGTAGPDSLTVDEVMDIVRRCDRRAKRTRAAIRLPTGRPARMVIAVADSDGTLLAAFRQPDATVFSIDVAIAKSRNVIFFSGPDRSREDMPHVPIGTAVTNRTISFGAQPLYPPGVDLQQKPVRGPWFSENGSGLGLLYENDTKTPCSQGSEPANLNQNGIVFFPGSAPLYRKVRDAVTGKKGKVLIGGLGVSGDGVEQDDFVTFAGTRKFRPARGRRADQVLVKSVRLPYLKFNRNPDILKRKRK